MGASPGGNERETERGRERESPKKDSFEEKKVKGGNACVK